MTLGHAALALSLASSAASLAFHDQGRAESSLAAFYAQMEKAEFPAARQSIGEAIRLWPGNARYYTWRAYASHPDLPNQCPFHGALFDARTVDRVLRAAEDYRRALALNPRDAVAHHNLAWLDHLMANNAEARREWEQAVAIDPGVAIYHLSFAFFLDEAGDPAQAKRQYVTAMELSPAILDSPFFLRYRKASPAQAEAIVHDAIAETESRTTTADPILQARLGKFYLYRGDLPRAAAFLESTAQELSMLWFNLSELRRLQGARDEAWRCYQKAQFLDSGLAGPALRMGEMYGEARQGKTAAVYLRSAAQKWSRAKSPTAGRNTRLYGGQPQPIDDLLPPTLFRYTTPCVASEAYKLLARLYPNDKVAASRVQTCEGLLPPHSAMPN